MLKSPCGDVDIAHDWLACARPALHFEKGDIAATECAGINVRPLEIDSEVLDSVAIQIVESTNASGSWTGVAQRE